MLGGFAALGSGAGLIELVHSTAEMSENLDIMSAQVGISAGELQRWDYIAKQSGIGADAMNNGLQKLNKNLGMAAAGKDKDLVALMKHLGINTKDAKGHLLDAADLLPKLADAFEKTQSAVVRANMANVLFGKSGADMLPLLDQGSSKMDELNDSLNEYVYPIKPEDTKNLGEFTDAWKNLGTSVQGLKDDLGAHLAPVFTPIVQGMADWISNNKQWISQDMATQLQRFGAMVKEQSVEIGTAFSKTGAMWTEQFGEMKDAWTSFEKFLYPGHALGGLPALPPPRPSLAAPGDVRAAMGMDTPHPYKEGPGWSFTPEPKPIRAPNPNLVMPDGDARTSDYYARPNLPGDDQLAATLINSGAVNVLVEFQNAPRGSKVTATATGIAKTPRVRLGYSSMSSEYGF